MYKPLFMNKAVFMNKTMFKYKTIFTLFCALLLSACSNLQISENDINTKAESWIAKGQTITLGNSSFLPALIPNAAFFTISEKHVKLNLNASLEMRTFLGNKTIANGFVVMSGVPYLEKDSGKIFIKEYDIENIEMITPSGKIWSIQGAMFDRAKQSIVNTVGKIPIYDINRDKKLSGVILSQVETIELAPGHIILVM